jgi:hypothetical protein
MEGNKYVHEVSQQLRVLYTSAFTDLRLDLFVILFIKELHFSGAQQSWWSTGKKGCSFGGT